MSNNLTLRKLANTKFPSLYMKFMTDDNLSYNELETLLAIAVLILNTEDENLKHLGYKIILSYCNKTKNYKPLYDLAINNELYPVSKFIEDNCIVDNDRNFFTAWNDASVEQFRKDDIYHTGDQTRLGYFFNTRINENISVIAPTSYGKSELIIEAIKQYSDRNICIVTSTKALLMQTKRRICKSRLVDGRKIIIHPEMYNVGDKPIIAVLTQERFQRLLKKDLNLQFDCIIVDEAHELLENTNRSKILASDLIVSLKRNANVSLKFLTPFICNGDNLSLRHTSISLEDFHVDEYMKSEKYYIHDIRNEFKKYYYDQFFNEYIMVTEESPGSYEEDIVVKNVAKKNIVYLNKPTDIEAFALALAESLPEIECEAVSKACNYMSEYLQPQYNLVTCLKKGVIYHHGSVPDAIRVYIEDLYKKIPEIKYVVTSSTLLSGVNLPAERLFILDNKRGPGNLSTEAFRNLVGRIGRLNDIFLNQKNDLTQLEPEIHLVVGKYFSQNANYKTFLSSVAAVNRNINDNVENVLLSNTIINENNKDELISAEESIENYEKGTIPNYSFRYATTDVGKSIIMNGISEINVFDNETDIQAVVDTYHEQGMTVTNATDLLLIIRELFISRINTTGYNNIKRLTNLEACSFYSMILNWRMNNKSYSEMIQLFVSYWRKLFIENRNVIIYVGRWGDVDNNGSHNKPYTQLLNKKRTQVINLAIVRIKEEQDFIDNDLIRFVEVLNDLHILDNQFYNKIKYGTDDETVICMLKNGLSLSLANLISDKYLSNIEINTEESTIEIKDELLCVMKANKENGILIHEIETFM